MYIQILFKFGSVQVVKEQLTRIHLSIFLRNKPTLRLSHKVHNMHLTLSQGSRYTDVLNSVPELKLTHYPEKKLQWTLSKLLHVLFIKCRWDGIVCGWAFFYRLDTCGHGQGNHVDTDYKMYDHTEWTPLLFHCAKSVREEKQYIRKVKLISIVQASTMAVFALLC